MGVKTAKKVGEKVHEEEKSDKIGKSIFSAQRLGKLVVGKRTQLPCGKRLAGKAQ